MKSSVLDTILIVLFLALLSPSCETKEIPEEKTLETPTNVVVHKATETSLVFQWSLVAKATSYEWKLSQASTQVASGTVQNRNVSISDLEPGTEYGFTVRAVSQDMVSSWSAAVQASTVAVPEPPTPGPSSIEYAEFAIPEWEEDGIARAFPGAEGGGM